MAPYQRKCQNKALKYLLFLKNMFAKSGFIKDLKISEVIPVY